MNPLEEIKKRIEESLRVLIVDDEPAIVSALKRELRKESFALEVFTDPAEALRALEKQEFALIVSDNLMPGMTGLELLSRAVKTSPRTRRFLLTGRTELNDAIQAFNEGVLHRFIPKPWEKAELIFYIQEALDDYVAGKLRQEAERLKDFVLRKRSEQYRKTLLELKQVQTRLFLQEDGQNPGAGWFSADLRKLRFLVVEENNKVREAISEALGKAGVPSCQGVSNGFDAMNHVIGSPGVDVVLADWSRNELEGLTLLEAIRKIKTLTHSPMFILITAEESKDSVRQAIDAGVDGYLIKPFRLDSLIEQLKRIQKKSRNAPLDKRIKALGKLNFLVANRDLTPRAEIEGVLAEIGMRNVVLVNSGKNLLRTLRDRPIDVVFYDTALQDPEWPGLTESIIGEDGRLSDPVLIVTSHSSDAREIKQVRQEGLPYVSVPFNRNNLSEAIIKAVIKN